jgi:hypothetical protein
MYKIFQKLNDKDFKELMAFYTITLSFIYMFCVTFFPIPEENRQSAQIILGSLLTIVIGKVLSEYFNKPDNKKEDRNESV